MLELNIDEQLLIPVRLIPYITGWNFSPDCVVNILANKEKWHRVFIPSYHLDSDGSPQLMLPNEWDVFISDLEIIENKLRALESYEDENYHRWREESIKTIPAGTFVWLSEFEEAWKSTYSGRLQTISIERPSDKELNSHPFIEPDLYKIIYEGFESLTATALSSKTTLNLQFIKFNELHQYMTIDPFYGVVDSVATEVIVRHIYRDNRSNLLLEFRNEYSLKHFKSDRVRELIYLWCGFLGLPAYKNGKPLTWQWGDFLEHWAENFQIDIAELREFLEKNSYHLPSAIYPGGVNSTERQKLLEIAGFGQSFDNWTVTLPKHEEELGEIQNSSPETWQDRKEKKAEEDEYKRKIDFIKKGNPAQELQSTVNNSLLKNIDSDKNDLELPEEVLNLIVRKLRHLKIEQEQRLNETKLAGYKKVNEGILENLPNGIGRGFCSLPIAAYREIASEVIIITKDWPGLIWEKIKPILDVNSILPSYISKINDIINEFSWASTQQPFTLGYIEPKAYKESVRRQALQYGYTGEDIIKEFERQLSLEASLAQVGITNKARHAREGVSIVIDEYFFAATKGDTQTGNHSTKTVKNNIECLPNLPSQRDDWVYAIKDAVSMFLKDKGRCPNEAEAWIQLRTDPPVAYKIKPELHHGEQALNMDGKAMGKRTFQGRWKRYTTIN